MRLKTISEIQYKFVTTNMNRANVTGVYGVGSVNDLYHKQPSHKHSRRKKRQQKPDTEQDTTPESR